MKILVKLNFSENYELIHLSWMEEYSFRHKTTGLLLNLSEMTSQAFLPQEASNSDLLLVPLVSAFSYVLFSTRPQLFQELGRRSEPLLWALD